MHVPILPGGLLAGLCLTLPLSAQLTSHRADTPPPVGLHPQWEELGPYAINGVLGTETSGRVSAIACDPLDAARAFVAGTDGGVWRTLDAGASWRFVSSRWPTTAGGALALDPTDPDIIYAGSGEGNYHEQSRYGLGLFKSVDGGDRWQQLGKSTFAGRCFSSIVVDPTDPQIVFAAISPAGGVPFGQRPAARQHPDRDGPFGVFRSTDGGVSWTHLTQGLPTLPCSSLAIHPTNPQVLYAAMALVTGNVQNGVYRTLDGGASWALAPGTLPVGSAVGRITLDVARSDGNRVYVLMAKRANSYGSFSTTLGGWSSADGGGSWTGMAIPELHPYHSGTRDALLGVDPTDANHVFIGGRTLHRSTDGGISFYDVTPGTMGQHALAFDAAGRVLVGSDGGVHRSPTGAGPWTSLNRGLGTALCFSGIAAHPQDEERFLGSTADNAAVRRDSFPLGWHQLNYYSGWASYDPDDPQRVFLSAIISGNFYRSVDGGVTFTWSGTGIDPTDSAYLAPFVVDPHDSNRLLYATNRIYRSTNGGLDWTPISPFLSGPTRVVRCLAQCPSHPDVVWAGMTDGRVYVSVDGGESFTHVLSTSICSYNPTKDIFSHPEDPATAWVTDARFGVTQLQVTHDYGVTWTALDANLPDVPANTVAVIPGVRDRIFLGTDRGLFFSPNGGGNWRRYGKGLPQAMVVDILLEPERNRIVVTTSGRGIWRAPLGLRVR